MVRSGYERECFQVYSSVRREALDECLVILGVEKLSIEEVQKVEWRNLDEKMKNWVHAVKVVVGVLLSGEKRLCDSLFGDLDELKDVCFDEIAKGCVMQLLNFGEAIAICKRSPEKLFRILDMYEALRDVFPDLQAMVSDGFLIGEVSGVLNGLGEAAKGTFAEFENCIRNETSKKPVITGDVHPLPRYVMNYLKLLVDYCDPMDYLLEISEEDVYRFKNDFGGDGSQLEAMSPLGRQILLLMSELEYNLVEKSKLYEDNALQQVFLMNNLHYLVRKVKESDLRKVLGDDWIRKRRGQVRQYATGYLRASWSKALSCLKDEGIGGSQSNASKMALKERFKSFNACFEEIYRTQTAWKVPDAQLREEMKISISEKVIPAYRSFVGRFRSQLEGRHAGKYIKYTPEDLEAYLLDLFEGTPAVLHHIRRKST
jgi:exocyst complex protein 7